MNDPGDSRPRLREVLHGYLLVEGAFPWPGAAGLTVDEVPATFSRAAHLGRAPGPEQLCREHPHPTGEVLAFFAASAPAGQGRSD
jgi:hypothetical protein